MPIDFSLLNTKQPVGGVVATLPRQPDQTSAFMSGLMSTLQQGSELQTQALQRQNLQQNMDQSKQVFPYQLNQEKIKSQAATDAYQAGQQQTAAFNQSWQTGMEYLQKNDPVGYLSAQKSLAETKDSLAKAADSMATTQTKTASIYANMASTGANLAIHSMEAETAKPGTGAQVYQQGLSYLPPDVAKLYPQDFSMGSYLTLTKLGMDATNQMRDQQAMKGMTPLQKNMKARDDLQNKISQQTQQGQTPNPQDQKDLATYNSKLNTDKNLGSDAFTHQAAQAQFAQVKANASSAPQIEKLINDTSLIQTKLAQHPEIKNYIGPIAGLTKLGFENTDIQIIDKLLAGIPLIQKSATLGQSTGQRLFMSELQMMVKSSGSTKINPDALNWIAGEQKLEAQIKRWQAWHQDSEAYNNVKDEGVKQSWFQSHPQPEEPRVEINFVNPQTGQLNASKRHITIPYTQLNDYLKSDPTARRWN